MDRGNAETGLVVVLVLLAAPVAAQDEALRKAVPAAMDWLVRHQEPEGRWSADGFSGRCAKKDKADAVCEGRGMGVHDAGVTGLALLALLATPPPKWNAPHLEAVKKGLGWLAAQQDREGCLGNRAHHSFNYSHAIATKALAEGYEALRVEEWKKSVSDAVQFSLTAQNPYKAWRYGVKPGDNDTSVTAWMVGALAAARSAGVEVPEEPLRWAASFIGEMTDEETGRTGYTRRGEHPVRPEGILDSFPGKESESLTAAGLHVRLLLGQEPKKNLTIERGIELLMNKPPVWNPAGGRTDFVYWHYATLALAKCGGKPWKGWRKAVAGAVVPQQVKSGCARGSWDPVDPWRDEGGRVAATALLAICVQTCVENPPASGG